MSLKPIDQLVAEHDQAVDWASAQDITLAQLHGSLGILAFFRPSHKHQQKTDQWRNRTKGEYL